MIPQTYSTDAEIVSFLSATLEAAGPEAFVPADELYEAFRSSRTLSRPAMRLRFNDFVWRRFPIGSQDGRQVWMGVRLREHA